MQSDGQSPANPDALIGVDVPAGPEYLEVENLGGASTYTLTTSLTPSTSPFQPIPISTSFPQANPTAIVAGDFNGDGRTDLAVANYGSNDVSVLLGNGDGTFQPQVTYAVGSGPVALVAGDFTGDGRTDLAVANSGDNDVSVLLGNGDGTFQPQVTYAVGYRPRRPRGGRLHRRRPDRPGRRQLAAPTTCRCCWATATAPSSPR